MGDYDVESSDRVRALSIARVPVQSGQPSEEDLLQYGDPSGHWFYRQVTFPPGPVGPPGPSKTVSVLAVESAQSTFSGTNVKMSLSGVFSAGTSVVLVGGDEIHLVDPGAYAIRLFFPSADMVGLLPNSYTLVSLYVDGVSPWACYVFQNSSALVFQPNNEFEYVTTVVAGPVVVYFSTSVFNATRYDCPHMLPQVRVRKL